MAIREFLAKTRQNLTVLLTGFEPAEALAVDCYLLALPELILIDPQIAARLPVSAKI